MRQNMAAAVRRAAADLGFGGAGKRESDAAPRESEQRRPNCPAAEGGSDRESRRADRIGIARWGKQAHARTHTRG